MKPRVFLLLIGATLAAAGLPGSIWSGSPLTPRHAPMPLFPQRLLEAGVVTGTVQLMIEVTPSGEVVDALATAYTHRAFADATLAAASTWRFAPAEVGHVAQISLRFETSTMTVVLKHGTPDLDAAVREGFRPCPPAELDQRPRPVSMVQPPSAPAGVQEEAGLVTIEYWIDEYGRVRMPAVQTTPDPLLAGLAIAALKQWRFTPPTCDGRPTLVRARQSFQFGAPSS